MIISCYYIISTKKKSKPHRGLSRLMNLLINLPRSAGSNLFPLDTTKKKHVPFNWSNHCQATDSQGSFSQTLRGWLILLIKARFQLSHLRGLYATIFFSFDLFVPTCKGWMCDRLGARLSSFTTLAFITWHVTCLKPGGTRGLYPCGAVARAKQQDFNRSPNEIIDVSGIGSMIHPIQSSCLHFQNSIILIHWKGEEISVLRHGFGCSVATLHFPALNSALPLNLGWEIWEQNNSILVKVIAMPHIYQPINHPMYPVKRWSSFQSGFKLLSMVGVLPVWQEALRGS